MKVHHHIVPVDRLLIVALTAAFSLNAYASAQQPMQQEERLQEQQTLSERERERQQLRRTPVVEVFERTRDAVVNISSTEIIRVRTSAGFDSMFEELFDMPRRPRTREIRRVSVGSGFVLHSDGYIVTNAHVVAGTAERKAIFADGSEYDAQIVAMDTDNDLAVLKIDAGRSLPVVQLGRSDDLMIGETVIAIGNPLGYQHTVTAGVVSAVDRNLEFSRRMELNNLIQTDASINPGNSGGPLLNVLGELIGINTAIRGDAQNIGFAIPVNRLRELLPDLLDVERRYRILAGLKIDSINDPVVLAVKPDSPADEAGIEVGDVITAIDGEPIREGLEYNIALIGRRPGSEMRLRVDRDGETFQTKMTLQQRRIPNAAALARRKLGIEVEPISARLASQLNLPRDVGLLITTVDDRSSADVLGVQPYDILLSLGRHSVSSMTDLGELLDQAQPGDTIPIDLLRIERHRKVRLTGTIEVQPSRPATR